MKRSEVDTLARLLDGEPVEQQSLSRETRALAALGTAMQASAVRPRAEFKQDLRTALIAEARAHTPTPSLLTRMRNRLNDTTARWRYSTRMAAASGAAAVALSGGGVAVAAQQALPGELLYPVRTVMEDARIVLIRDDVARGERQLALASERVDDAARVVAADGQEAATRALRDSDVRARKGAGSLISSFQVHQAPQALDELARFSASQRARIEALAPDLRGSAVVAASDALIVLDRIDARIAALLEGCPECPTGGSFDYSVIPPASEAFDACPCVQASGDGGGETTRDSVPVDPSGQAPSATDQSPSGGGEAGSQPSGDAAPRAPADERDAPADDGLRVPVTDSQPVDDTQRAIEDTTQKVVDDVLKKAVEDLPVDGSSQPDVDEALEDATGDLLP